VDADAGDAQGITQALRRQVGIWGVGGVQLDRALGDGELLDLASRWGAPLAEHAPEVRRFVDQECILNLVPEWDRRADVDRQPFSSSSILLHTEGSRRPVRDQPRYLVFSCRQPPAPDEGGQTVLVRMDEVASALPAAVTEVLGRVRYAGAGMPPLARTEGTQTVFSFRDFGTEPLELVRPPAVGARSVEEAIEALLATLYDPGRLVGLGWTRHLLVVLDNHRVFHGRTALADLPAAPAPRTWRWIRRVRVRA
jgi:alpha-ketoglutarate-dependent taurine dioxygenase